jgi:CDP-glycerol glycerophosphotransferase (TagB/SpsB family)
VFVYHATGDKTFRGVDRKLQSEWFEYYFLTGDKDLYKLRTYTDKPELLEDKIIKIGMLRSDPIINNSYDREKILKRYGITPNGKKIILYAPTWKWGGGSLGKCFETFATEITKNYVLIIRPHYNDRKNIRNIIKWQRKHKVRDLHIFSKQYQDIMNFICISDLLIGDNSSVNYDFAVTKKPVVIVDSPHEDVFIPPDEFNIRLCGPLYDPEKDNILEKVEDAFNNPEYRKQIENLVDRSFYFNDGHAVDRACSFIVDKLCEMGIHDRKKILKKYGNRFTYMNNYY